MGDDPRNGRLTESARANKARCDTDRLDMRLKYSRHNLFNELRTIHLVSSMRGHREDTTNTRCRCGLLDGLLSPKMIQRLQQLKGELVRSQDNPADSVGTQPFAE